MNTKKQLRKALPMLKILNNLNADELTTMLSYLSSPACEAIYECVQNAISNDKIAGEVKLTIKSKLLKHKKHLRKLNDNKTSSKLKQKHLVQAGSGIGAILTAVLPMLASFLVSHVAK